MTKEDGARGHRRHGGSLREHPADGDDAANNAKLLAELAGVPDGERAARFACTLVFIDEEASPASASVRNSQPSKSSAERISDTL